MLRTSYDLSLVSLESELGHGSRECREGLKRCLVSLRFFSRRFRVPGTKDLTGGPGLCCVVSTETETNLLGSLPLRTSFRRRETGKDFVLSFSSYNIRGV